MVAVQTRWRWDMPTRGPYGRDDFLPDQECWTTLAATLPEYLETLVIEAMRHATNECGWAGTNPYECPHVSDAMDAAFTAVEQALPPERSIADTATE